jgi:SAM-dependent methyltransferase
MRSSERAPLAQAVELAGLQPGERVLDLSGRAGSIALQVASVAASVESVQPEEGLAAEGQRLADMLGRENVYFHHVPLDRLPFDPGQFDLVFWCLTLAQAPLPLHTVAEIARVLRPGGRLVLQEVTAFGRADLDLRIAELERRRNCRHVAFYTEEEVRALLEAPGLSVSRMERTSLTQHFDYWVDTAVVTPEEVEELRRVFFTLSLADQALLDLSLADEHVSFTYPVTTLLVRRD